jgi:O-antigen/teichoic acid export membrane protein
LLRSERARVAEFGLRGLVRLPVFIQASVFTGSNILVSLLGMISSAVLARNLVPPEFGLYAFAVSFISFVVMFFEFGISLPAARLTAQCTEPTEARKVAGASFLAFVPVGLLFAGVIYALSYTTGPVFHTDVGPALRFVAPLLFVYPFIGLSVSISQGIDRLHTSSLTSVVSQALFVAFLLIAVTVASHFSVATALLFRAAAFALGSCVFVAWVRPLLAGALGYVRPLLLEVRAYGFSVYIGRILSVGTYNLDTLMVAAFAGARSVGFYVLAGSIAYASGLPATGMATALFARMTRVDQLDRRWLALSWCVGLAAVAFTAAVAHPFLSLVFSPRYAAAYVLVLPLALAQLLRGVTTLYNMFLSAHARGRELRNAAIVLTASNLLFNFALIPPFGAQGAAWASFFALVLNLGAHIFYYRRSLDTAARPAAA